MDEMESSGCASEALVRGVAVLQEKWVLLIVNRLLQGPCGFNELSRKAHGVNATTLSQRLALLEDAGILTKTVQSTMPPRTSYQLTESGQAIEPVLREIEGWSERFLEQRKACPLLEASEGSQEA